jgi:hypothetical protein
MCALRFQKKERKLKRIKNRNRKRCYQSMNEKEILKNIFMPDESDKKFFQEQTKLIRERRSFRRLTPIIGTTPFIYTQLKMRKGKIIIFQNAITKIIEKHQIPWGVIDNLLDYLVDPVMIFKSLDKNNPERLIIVTSFIDKSNIEKRPIGFILTQSKGANNTIVLVSGYGIPEHNIKKCLEAKKLIYLNEEGISEIASKVGLHSIYALTLKGSNLKDSSSVLTKKKIVKIYEQGCVIKKSKEDW